MWIQISSGKGPDECELAVSLFLEAFRKECNKKDIKANVLAAVPGHVSGNLQSVLLSLEAQENNSLNEINSGTILWVCTSRTVLTTGGRTGLSILKYLNTRIDYLFPKRMYGSNP